MFSLVNLACAAILVYLSKFITSWTDLVWIVLLVALEEVHNRYFISKK